jgi:apolipoprotein D and lipocalin family protein
MFKRLLLIVLHSFTLTACSVKLPDGVTPVDNFALEAYLGRWYEIARLDHSFERGMSQVTAEYSLRTDGGVRVLNRGFNDNKGKWEDAEGRAYFVQNEQTGFLKVSFFGPFYGAYVIIDHDPNEYSLVSGPDRSYLWILARTPTLPQQTIDRLLARATSLGFDTNALIWVAQDRQETQE